MSVAAIEKSATPAAPEDVADALGLVRPLQGCAVALYLMVVPGANAVH